eukprot:8945381-Pyramimonas_sp.AAC.1
MPRAEGTRATAIRGIAPWYPDSEGARIRIRSPPVSTSVLGAAPHHHRAAPRAHREGPAAAHYVAH